MPIRPENRKRYPPGWPAISRRIRFDRACGRCECRGECGTDHENEKRIYGGFIEPASNRCHALNGASHPFTGSMVVLTVAHIDHTPEHCHDSNLLAMCQRCHNRLDAPMRAAGIKARRRAGNAIADLFEEK